MELFDPHQKKGKKGKKRVKFEIFEKSQDFEKISIFRKISIYCTLFTLFYPFAKKWVR